MIEVWRARNGSSATQHFDHAISSDIAIMYSREIKTAEQLVHHTLHDIKRSYSNSYMRNIQILHTEVTDPTIHHAEAR